MDFGGILHIEPIATDIFPIFPAKIAFYIKNIRCFL